MSITPKEKKVIDRFNEGLVRTGNAQERPTDAELAKMSDAEILAGDWLVDIEDTVFWNRWDEANSNLTLESAIKPWTNQRLIDALVRQGKASFYPKR